MSAASALLSASPPLSSDFLAGGGRMGERIARFDWSTTPLGAIDHWPADLRVAAALVVNAQFATALVWGPSMTTLYNDRFEPILGARTDALGRSFRDIWSEAWPTIGPIVDRAFAGEATFMEDMPLVVTRNGGDEETFFTFAYSPVRADDGRVLGMMDTVVETTRRVLAERDARRTHGELEAEILRRAQERDQAWNLSQDIQLVLDRRGAIRETNQAWTAVLGWTLAESIGRPLEAFVSNVDPACELHVAELVHTIDSTRPVELCLRHADGTTRWASWLTTVQDDVIHASGRNITSEKFAALQLEQAREQLRQAQKMEAFGQLTGGIAHDFNNLLQAVSGSLEMLGRKHVHEEAGQRMLRLATKAVDRAAHLTSQLLAFARKQSLDMRSIDTNAAMATSIELVRRSLPSQIEVAQRFLPTAWPVMGDPNQLDVALLNLIINARDAMPDGGTITVSTDNLAAPGTDLPDDLAPGQYVRITVADSGVGMSDEVRARVFEPFFTTKGIGKGTGLGLSQVYGFAHQSGGSVRIASAAGQGTAVEIFLPKAMTPEAVAVDPAERTAWRGRETVLVVDDDRDVRELSVACLEEYGYRVLEARSGLECLERLGQEASVDLLLIDYAMPEMNGAETVRLARRIRPDLEVLFITGYADLRALAEHVEPGSIIAKPFKLAQLADRVAQGLARRPQHDPHAA